MERRPFFVSSPADLFFSLLNRFFSGGRLAKYARGLIAGYGSLAAVFAFTGITVPLGISSMGLAGWGVWVFCQQASATICLFENFTQSAYVRLLIQVKDDTSSESYKKMVWMGRWSFWAQGGLLLAAHAAFAAVLSNLFPNLSGTDAWMTICVMGLASLINQAGKINGQLLYAHQHQDRASLAATSGLLVNLLVVVVCLPRHPTAQTMAWAFLAGSLAGQILYWGFARLAKCLPTYPGAPSIQLSDFQPLWFWGKRFFLFSLLNNLSTSLPTLLAGRSLPLEIVGIWGVLQRVANMVSQAVLKIPQTAVPALMEMHTRGEETRFHKRSQQILWTQNALAGTILGFFAFGGEFLLKVWLGKEMPLGGWILPLFTLSLLADFDQRFRFDLETVRLMMRRPTLIAFLKIILILISIPPLSYFYGLTGMILALAIISGLVLLPLSLLRIPSRSYSLPVVCTLAGVGAYLLAAGAGWLVMQLSLKF